MEDMERRDAFMERLLGRLDMEAPYRDTCWFLMHSAYQEGYIDGLYDGYKEAADLYTRPIQYTCCDPFGVSDGEDDADAI